MDHIIWYERDFALKVEEILRSFSLEPLLIRLLTHQFLNYLKSSIRDQFTPPPFFRAGQGLTRTSNRQCLFDCGPFPKRGIVRCLPGRRAALRLYANFFSYRPRLFPTQERLCPRPFPHPNHPASA